MSVLAALACLSAISGAAAQQRPWDSVAHKVSAFGDRAVSGIAFAESLLYVVAGHDLFTYDPRTGSATLMTARIVKGPVDDITDVHVDSARAELWIDTNSNFGMGGCYGYDLIRRCTSNQFVTDHLDFSDSLTDSTPRSSIWVWERDGNRVLVGFFKGEVSLFSLPERRFTLLYRPSSIYNWPFAVSLRGNVGLAGTRGDGLIAITLTPRRVIRYPDSDPNNGYIRAIVVHGDDVFLGSRGLFQAKLADFLPR